MILSCLLLYSVGEMLVKQAKRILSCRFTGVEERYLLFNTHRLAGYTCVGLRLSFISPRVCTGSELSLGFSSAKKTLVRPSAASTLPVVDGVCTTNCCCFPLHAGALPTKSVLKTLLTEVQLVQSQRREAVKQRRERKWGAKSRADAAEEKQQGKPNTQRAKRKHSQT